MKRWMFSILLLTLLLSGCAIVSPTLNPIPPASQIPTILPTTEPVVKNTAHTTEQDTEGLTLVDGLGREVVMPNTPSKIVSLAPSNTEILFAVGAGDQVVGRDSFSDNPAEALEVPDIGGDFGELNIELIVSLTPDLILASELSPPEQISSLEKMDLTVYYLSNPEDMEGLYENLITVGKLTGHEQEASVLAGELRERVALVEEKVGQANERPLVFYELDGTESSNPWTAGAGTFIDKLITMAGGNNLGGKLESEWAQMSLEALLIEDPEYILLGDSIWGGVTVESVRERTGWQNLSAVKEGRVFPFDDNLLSRPGPRMVDGLEALARLLHPDLFE
ncbi:MAG: ABC transporter substrate-binding protein [Chloroflexi bacterium]|nr:MAG: ABC transporter substrate-binding protein [Chloroflexota bacterium]